MYYFYGMLFVSSENVVYRLKKGFWIFCYSEIINVGGNEYVYIDLKVVLYVYVWMLYII